MISTKYKHPIKSVILFLVFVFLLVMNLVPFLWGLSTSLKAAGEINSYPPKFIASPVTTEHYLTVLRSNFTKALLNSLFYSAITIVVCILCASIFAYAFTRYSFVGRKIIFYLILCGIPLAMGSAALVVPNYLLFSYMNIVNKWYTLPLIYIAYNLPMACWIMIGGMENVPVSIEEASVVDGAPKWYIMLVLVPRLCLPSIASAALMTFIGAWNEYVVSSVLVSSTAFYPIQVSIYTYLGYFGREWGPLMASSILAMIPILIVFTFMSRLLISGLTAGAVKE
jgi:ABC-type glycerol-3-phosphate transport system permease component